jgi:hypothetical protein
MYLPQVTTSSKLASVTLFFNLNRWKQKPQLNWLIVVHTVDRLTAIKTRSYEEHKKFESSFFSSLNISGTKQLISYNSINQKPTCEKPKGNKPYNQNSKTWKTQAELKQNQLKSKKNWSKTLDHLVDPVNKSNQGSSNQGMK